MDMADYTLPACKLKQLKKFHKTLKQNHEADRIKAVVLLGSGWTPAQVAEVLLLSEGSVRTYSGGRQKLLLCNSSRVKCKGSWDSG